MSRPQPTSIYADIEDVEDVLRKIELSYKIKFVTNEMAHLKTFGEISSYIIAKIELKNIDDCTSQQTFYKLRSAIQSTGISAEILPTTSLRSLFPYRNRRKQIAAVEKNIGFKINALRPKPVTVKIILSFFLFSIILIFFNWKYGLAGFAISIILTKISDKTASHFCEETVGDLSKSIMYENYIESRTDPKTINKQEILRNIEALFIRELGLSSEFSRLHDDTLIVD